MARTAHIPLPHSRRWEPRHRSSRRQPCAAKGDEGNDDSIDDLDDLPDDDVSPASAAGFGLYNAHEEAATW